MNWEYAIFGKDFVRLERYGGENNTKQLYLQHHSTPGSKFDKTRDEIVIILLAVEYLIYIVFQYINCTDK